MGELNDWRSRPRGPRPDLAERNRASAPHGMTGTPTLKSWNSMCQRVRNSRCKDYRNYGGRSIDMDPRWADFVAFYEDMGDKPEGMTLGRIDNDRGYWPDNCRWETPQQQANNRRSTRRITIQGRTQTIAQWAYEIGVTRQTLRYRIEAGWPENALLTQPDRAKRRKQ